MTSRARGVYTPLPDTPQVESPQDNFNSQLVENVDEKPGVFLGPAHGLGDVWSSASSGYISVGCGSEISFEESGFSRLHTIDDDDDDSDWEEEDWPLDKPLPLPEWGCERPELNFKSLEDYEIFTGLISKILQDNIQTFTYDTLSNFIMFSREYQSQNNISLKDFYREYDPPLIPGRYTCVGLSADLAMRISSLEKSYPGLKDAMYQVSCEEDVVFVETYCESPLPPVLQCEKDHVLACVKIKINNRPGVLLLDSGYHVAVPITVMEDRLYPQTPSFIASKKKNVTKIYSYEFCDSNSSFVLWDVVEYCGEERLKSQHNVIHVTRPYLSGVDVAERRNLIYPFKTMLSRNKDGTLKAGLYFPVIETEKCKVTLLYQTGDETTYVKVPLSYFLLPPVISNDCDKCTDNSKGWQMQNSWEYALSIIEDLTGNTHDLRASLSFIANMLNNKPFLKQLYDINDSINMLSIEN